MASSVPLSSSVRLSSLRLLVPPLRLLTAAMWQIVRQQSVKHYGELGDFVSLVTAAVPQLLTDRQRTLLLLALRAKVALSDLHPLDRTCSVSKAMEVEKELNKELDKELDACRSTLSALSRDCPVDSRRLLLEVFDQRFDSALQSLISDFLSRLEQLFPAPDFKQAASWLHAAHSDLEDCLHQTDEEELKQLLTNQSCLLGRATTTVGGDTEKTLLSAWSHPLLTKLTNPHPPPAIPDVQSDTVPDVDCPLQLDVELDQDVQSDTVPDVDRPLQLDMELVKVEVVVTTEDEQEDTVIGLNTSDEDRVQRPITPVEVEVDRWKDSPGHLVQGSPDTGESCSQVQANALYSISHNSQRVAHRCPGCSRCFIYRSQVIRHLRTNKSCGSALTGVTEEEPRPTGEEPQPTQVDPAPPEPRPVGTHSCFQCNAVFRTGAELLSHRRSHRARPVYHCSQCGKNFHHLSSLTNHKQSHLDEGQSRLDGNQSRLDGEGFPCSRCDEVFDSAKERDAHRLQHRPPDLGCTVCSQTFSSQTQLLRHMQSHSVEGARPRYSCRFCEQTFSGVTQLRIHQRTHASRSFQCDQCPKTYGSLTGLHSHQASHSTESRFLCPQCGKRFKTRDGLEGHLRTHTGERPYRCPYCPKDFTALAGLNVHVRRHTGERPYVCTVCGKGWPSGGDLQKHMRTHTGERPYVCQDCGKAFSISCHLTEHRRIHTGEKPFSCPECGKCLRRKFDLKKHMLSHSSVRPYACTYCPKSYTRKTHLNRHLLTHGTADGETGGDDPSPAS
ncbi:zinc finger protein 569-like [Mugil cephalus]|uniref:zinc finger protein 569-like n=1 Tax=Mugil cephalus TaxID=48193 RepID=UPI001FB5CC76|nr:zinc finger protein 569-like [Mugil cephalus]